MKKLKIFLLISILLCFGFALKYEIHAQSVGPKPFEVDDILPATTQLRISWVGDITAIPYPTEITSDNNTFKLVIRNAYGTLVINQNSPIYIWDDPNAEFVSPYTNYDGNHAYFDIDISTWDINKRTISSVDNGMDIFRWEDLTQVPSGYTITFNSNGGSTISDIEGVTELPIPLPVPTKANHTFLGWYYDSTFTNKALADDPLTSDVTLYAKWILYNYYDSKPFEVGDVLPAGEIKISWDFWSKPNAPDDEFWIKSDGIFEIKIEEFGHIYLYIMDDDFIFIDYYDGPFTGETIITLTSPCTITELYGDEDYYEYIDGALFWEVVPDGYSAGYLDGYEVGYAAAREYYGWKDGDNWYNGTYAWNLGEKYARELYGYYDSNTGEWLSVEEYLELYGTDKPGQSDFYGNFDKYFIPAMIIVFGGAIVLTVLKVFKGRE